MASFNSGSDGRKKPQVSPLRFAPVPRQAGAGGMTIPFKFDDLGEKSIKSQPLRMRILWRVGDAKMSVRPTYALASEGHPSRGFRFVVSHISRKTSEMWGTHRLWKGRNLRRDGGLACTEGFELRACGFVGQGYTFGQSRPGLPAQVVDAGYIEQLLWGSIGL